jgi:hypothetical protein
MILVMQGILIGAAAGVFGLALAGWFLDRKAALSGKQQPGRGASQTKPAVERVVLREGEALPGRATCGRGWTRGRVASPSLN